MLCPSPLYQKKSSKTAILKSGRLPSVLQERITQVEKALMTDKPSEDRLDSGH